MKSTLIKIATLWLACSAAIAQTSESERQSFVPIDSSLEAQFNAVAMDERVQAALIKLEEREEEAIREQIRITEIPAPPFQEERRAAYFLERVKERGLADAHIDDEGNVVATRPGTGNGPTLLIAAHLDTVFSAGVDTTVEFRDGRYYAPGIGDDTRGLTVLLSILER